MSIYQILADGWQRTPGSLAFIALCTALTFVVAVLFARDTLRKDRAVPRMIRTTGKVIELSTSTRSRRSTSVVKVAYRVNGADYTCGDLYLFRGNHHGRKPEVAPAMDAGRELLVYYDPRHPKVSALIIDRPSYANALIAAAFCCTFAFVTVDLAGKF